MKQYTAFCIFVIVQMFKNVILILLFFFGVLSRCIVFDEAKQKCSSPT